MLLCLSKAEPGLCQVLVPPFKLFASVILTGYMQMSQVFVQYFEDLPGFSNQVGLFAPALSDPIQAL